MITRDQKQAMHTRSREDDGVGEFEAGALADEDRFRRDSRIDFQQIESVQKPPYLSFQIGCFGPHQKFDPNNAGYRDFIVTIQFLGRRLDTPQLINQNICIEKRFHPR